MKAMNFETAKWRRAALDDVVIDEETLARRRRRRNIIIAAIVFILVAIVAIALLGGRGEQAPAPKGRAGGTLQAVTVIAPGRREIDRVITATGSLGARRDMPVGVPGSGGQIGGTPLHGKAPLTGRGIPPARFQNDDGIMSIGNVVEPQHYVTFLDALNRVTAPEAFRYGGAGPAPPP